MLEPTVIEDIEYIAKRAEIPPATLARNLIKSSLDEAKLLDKFGLVRLIGSSRRKLDELRQKYNITYDGMDDLKND